jgi:hypothetical protein
VALGGCFKVEQTITLEADGSGKQSLSLSCGDAILETVRGSAAAAGQGTADPLRFFDRDAVEKELVAAGLSAGSYEHTRQRGVHEVRIGAAFPALAQLRKSPLLGGAATWVFLAGKRKGDVVLVLYPRGKAAHEEAKERVKALAQQDAEVLRALFEKRKLQIEGLSIKLAIDLPGDVVASSDNWRKTGDRQVTASIGASDVKTIEDLILLMAPRFEVTFDGSKCKLALDEAEPAARAAAPR